MSATAFALILTFSDGYLGGHTTASYVKTKAVCEKQGEQLVSQYLALGHPTVYSCLKSEMPKRVKKPEVTVHNFPTVAQ